MPHRHSKALLLALTVLVSPAAIACSGGAKADAAGKGKYGAKGKRGGKGGYGGPGGTKGGDALPVEVTKLAKADVERRVQASGTLGAVRTAEIRSVQTGVVESLKVEEGDEVTEGQTLARLDGRELALMASRDRVAQKNAQEELQRLEQIAESGAIAREEIVLKRQEVRSAKAAAKVSRYQASLTVVKAPFAGTITTRHVDVGNLATTATVLYDLADLSALQIELHLPEREAIEVENSDPVSLSLLDGTEFSAAIQRRAPAVDPLTGTVKFTVRAAERPDRAIPGAFTRASILVEAHRDVPTLPGSAVVTVDAKTYVYVVEEGKAHRVEVSTGLRDAGLVEITDGLADDAVVIKDASDGINEGMSVKVFDPEAKGATGEGSPADGAKRAQAKRKKTREGS